ncbi:MAG TPA: hypothetical protein VKE22_12895 [Haliangiales bacterium]|nr:hypothetical protein [Haliangiales bacterium]
MRLGPFLLLAALAGGCATLKNDTTVCPEYRDLRCATSVDCAFDNARGCRVCRCARPEDLPQPPPPSTLPPQ